MSRRLASNQFRRIWRPIRQSIADHRSIYVGLGSAAYIALALASLSDLHNAALVGFLYLVVAGSHILGHFHDGT